MQNMTKGKLHNIKRAANAYILNILKIKQMSKRDSIYFCRGTVKNNLKVHLKNQIGNIVM